MILAKINMLFVNHTHSRRVLRNFFKLREKISEEKFRRFLDLLARIKSEASVSLNIQDKRLLERLAVHPIVALHRRDMLSRLLFLQHEYCFL